MKEQDESGTQYRIKKIKIQAKSAGDWEHLPTGRTNTLQPSAHQLKNIDPSINTRSLKGKTIELSSVTSNADIVCITETHIEDTIKNHQIFDYNSKLIRIYYNIQ